MPIVLLLLSCLAGRLPGFGTLSVLSRVVLQTDWLLLCLPNQYACGLLYRCCFAVRCAALLAAGDLALGIVNLRLYLL